MKTYKKLLAEFCFTKLSAQEGASDVTIPSRGITVETLEQMFHHGSKEEFFPVFWGRKNRHCVKFLSSMRLFRPRMSQNRWRLWQRPRTHRMTLQRFPDPLAGFVKIWEKIPEKKWGRGKGRKKKWIEIAPTAQGWIDTLNSQSVASCYGVCWCWWISSVCISRQADCNVTIGVCIVAVCGRSIGRSRLRRRVIRRRCYGLWIRGSIIRSRRCELWIRGSIIRRRCCGLWIRGSIIRSRCRGLWIRGSVIRRRCCGRWL